MKTEKDWSDLETFIPTSSMTGGEHFKYWIEQNQYLVLCPMPEDAIELTELLKIAYASEISL